MMKFGWLAALSALVVGGCSSIGGGLPAGQAQVVISGHSEGEIQLKAEEVFYRHDFAFKGGNAGRMYFERAGGALDNLLYGNWQGEDTFTKVTLFIKPLGDDSFELRARSMVVRDTFGEAVDDENFDVQGARYGVLLNKIRAELDE
jgi:hypothetical protein